MPFALAIFVGSTGGLLAFKIAAFVGLIYVTWRYAMLKKWLPWMRADWHLTEDAHSVLRFMSTQINIIGASVVAFQMWAAWPVWTVMATLVGWVGLAAFGAVIQQPELEE